MRYVCFVLLGVCSTVVCAAEELKSVLVPAITPAAETPVQAADLAASVALVDPCQNGVCRLYAVETRETTRERKLLRGGYVIRQSERVFVRPIRRR
jgi:hypothetical protein